MSNQAVDFSLIEASKENIQPLKHGRKVVELVKHLDVQKTTNEKPGKFIKPCIIADLVWSMRP